MVDEQIRVTLSLLQQRQEESMERVGKIKEDLSNAEQELAHIQGAITHLEGLESKCSESGTYAPAVDNSDFEAAEGASSYQVEKRLPSTSMVAAIVSDNGGAIDRDSIIAEFDRRFGIPESWTNPRNSIGNALSRASSRGLIRRISQDEFLPVSDYTPADLSRFERS